MQFKAYITNIRKIKNSIPYIQGSEEALFNPRQKVRLQFVEGLKNTSVPVVYRIFYALKKKKMLEFFVYLVY